MVLTLPHCSMEAEVVVKKANGRGGYGLEIPVRYHFVAPAKAMQRLVKKKLRNSRKIV